MIDKIFESLGNNPTPGAGITTGSFLSGIFLQITPLTMTMISDILQIIAFAVSIAVGVMTMISINRKNKKK